MNNPTLRDIFSSANSMADRIDVLLRYAVRAPSTHNIQPWLFSPSEEKIALYLDHSRSLPEADEEGRDAFISLGACFEHLIIAAKYFGMYTSHTITTKYEVHAPVAVLFLKQSDGIHSEYFSYIEAIEHRYNARGPFEQKEIPNHILDGIKGLAKEEGVGMRVLSGSEKKSYSMLVAEGMRLVHSRKSFRRELSSWIRNNYSKKLDGIPGYTMLAPGVFSFLLPWVIGTFNTGPILAKLNTKSILSASSAAIIHSKDDSPNDWFKVGMYFERISLYLAQFSVRTSIYVAAVEVPTLREKLCELLHISAKPQFAFTFGYPMIPLRQSPRFPPSMRLYDTNSTQT